QELALHHARRAERRPGADDAAAAAARTHAIRRGGRIAGLHAHALDRYRQRVGQCLGDRRQVALALADHADLGRDGATRPDPDDGGIVTRAGDAGRLVELRAVRVWLDVGGDPEPHNPSGRTRLLLRTPGFLVVERLERALKRVAWIDRPVDE